MSRRTIQQEQSSDEEIVLVPTAQAPQTKKRRTAVSRSSKGSKSTPARPAEPMEQAQSTNDLWSTINYIWPAHERPPGLLQDRKWVNSQSYESISLMKKESKVFTTPPPSLLISTSPPGPTSINKETLVFYPSISDIFF